MATASAAGILAVAGTAAPALAQPVDTFAFNTSQVDFGQSWSNNQTTSDAELDWDTGNGNTCVTGNLYMKNAANVTAQVQLEIYSSASHGGELPLATTKSAKKKAVGNALNTFVLSIPCQKSPGTHAHIKLVDDHANIGGALTQSAIAIEDE
jgi:hypothetical protein